MYENIGILQKSSKLCRKRERESNVQLLLNYNNLDQYDIVYISKVFTDTPIDENILKLPNVKCGGTGFFYDKAPALPYEIEHHMPDYDLYNEFIQNEIGRGMKPNQYKDYQNYSIGFATKGCIRQCLFCVNRSKTKVEKHSPIKEFYNPTKKYIYLWDDNFLAYPNWKEILDDLEEVNKPFQFRQGLDLRLMTEEKAERLSKIKYHGDFIFAFDDINDKKIIEEKLKLWKKYCKKTTKFYVFCGFDRENKWDTDFWKQDIINTFERVKILMQYECVPYIMRFNRYIESPYYGTYINLARWCNQPNFFKKKSYREYCMANQERTKNSICSTMRYLNQIEELYPEISKKYFDMKYEELNKYNNKNIIKREF